MYHHPTPLTADSNFHRFAWAYFRTKEEASQAVDQVNGLKVGHTSFLIV
jgi:hypothetical protein